MSNYPKPSKTVISIYDRFYKDTFEELAIGYSKDIELRERCASGGLVSSLLIDRISKGFSNGAIVARIKMGNDGPIPYSYLAKNRNDIIKSSGSIYSDFDHVGEIKRILAGENGIIDIVALPCQIKLLRKYLSLNKEISDRVGLLIGLWCGHATDKQLLSDLLNQWKVNYNDIESFKYKKGHWRGKTEIVMKNGLKIVNNYFRNYGLFQNMYVDCKQRCFSCTDHFAELSDISFGDCWIASEKSSRIKKTIVLSMNKEGTNAIQQLVSSDLTEVRYADVKLAIQAQKRTVIWHTYSCKARSVLGKLFGLNIHCELDLKPRINDYLSAFMVLFSFRLFNTRFRKILLKCPWWILFPFMVLQKLMLNK
ncbi:MAG: Coenzyme F420 hydrogenase/dehydrogenase, beta subunit C-terminal domain [Candidatus Kariarchaeaceae archaeon]